MPYDHLRTESLRDLTRMQGRGKPPAEVIEPYNRPRIRADCASVPRPCPFAGCRYNLAIEVKEGGLRYRAGGFAADWPEGAPSCALDVAAEGPRTLPEVAKVMGLARTRVIQIEREAKKKLSLLAGLDAL